MLKHNQPDPHSASEKCCVVCQKTIFHYAFKSKKNTFLQCVNCATITPEANVLTFSEETSVSEKVISRDSDALLKLILEAISNRPAQESYLVISTKRERPLAEKLKMHLPNSTVFLQPCDLSRENQPKFGAIILLTPLSMIQNTTTCFQSLRRSLHPEGLLFFLQPMLDSSQAKLMKNSWLEWNEPHTFFPTRDTLHLLLLKQGFDRVWFRKARYAYTLDYIHRRFKQSNAGILSLLVAFCGLLPAFMRKIKLKLPSSHIIVSSQLATPKIHPTLSIIIPVFNEKNTFEDLIQALLAKEIEGLRKEIIIVESNSTDGTRDIVKKYASHPDIQVLWQEQPKGKGFAVREGLAHATGEYVLIQDADLEYDINDYENLLIPLRENQAMFVLGSRHSGSWKIREFNDAAATAAVFNIGHLFFTWFINLLTRQRMADPFTMFKVLRRDAFFGLEFICKRFDFDHEMVIKLIRKGYQPLELPVNYRARSFAEGKKVSFIKDGLTWVYTDLKLRFGRLGKWSH